MILKKSSLENREQRIECTQQSKEEEDRFQSIVHRIQDVKNIENKLKLLILCSLFSILFTLLSGCYSFRGTSLDPNLKTILIQNFSFQTAGGPANLSLTFNEKLKEYFQRNTSLKNTTTNPDLMFEGAITGFEVEAKAPTSDDKGGLNRLTIKIQVKFTNAKDESKNYDQEFSFYQDFAQTQTVTAVQGELIPKILDQIVLDIFNKTAGEW